MNKNQETRTEIVEQLIEKAPAKINLSLGILGTQIDNYHILEMINHDVNLSDELILTPSDHFEFKVNQKHLENSDNLVVRVVKLLSQLVNRTPNFKIELIKNIPENAGLGGGSSDAAAAIRLLLRFWNIEIEERNLNYLALKIGADVPYCLKGGTALVEGIGQKITPLKDFKPEAILILKPDIKVKTPQAFKMVDKEESLELPDNIEVIRAIESENYHDLKKYARNSFTNSLAKRYPTISENIDKLYDNGAFFATMSGSGPTIIGYFDSVEKRDQAAKEFNNIEKYAV